MKEEDKELYRASIKSADTEELLDMWFYRPLGFRCALFFRNRGVHPNIITIASIFLGIAAGICFMQNNIYWNLGEPIRQHRRTARTHHRTKDTLGPHS